MKILETKVLVIGGSASGVCAAIQAARLGTEVTLIEETAWLGGMLTAAGVSATDGNHRLPSGLWGEFRQRLYDHYGSASAVETGWVSNTLFEPHVGQQIFQDMCDAESTLTVLKGYQIASILKNSNRVIGAEFFNNQGVKLRILSQITIEATEYGDALTLAGCEYRVGRESQSETGERFAPESADDMIQDITYVAILKDYGIGANRSIPKPPNYDPTVFHGSCKTSDDQTDQNLPTPEKMLEYGKLPNGKYMINWPLRGNDYYVNAIEMNPKERISALQSAKDFTLGFVYYIQTELGYKHLGLADDEFPTTDRLALIPYNRESRRIIGKVRLKLEDVEDIYKSPYKSGIAVGDYPLDHHHHKCPKPANETYPQISSFTIPFGCLIPAMTDGLLVAEKSISVTHYVNGCTRLQPCVMSIGQAAGAAAALCVRKNIQPRELDIRELQQVLLEAKTYLMPFSDVKTDDPAFQAIQRIGATGILKGEPIHHDWVNELRFNPDEKVTKKELVTIVNQLNLRLHKNVSSPSERCLTRRDFAVWLDKQFDPFNTIPVQ